MTWSFEGQKRLKRNMDSDVNCRFRRVDNPSLGIKSISYIVETNGQWGRIEIIIKCII